MSETTTEYEPVEASALEAGDKVRMTHDNGFDDDEEYDRG